MGFVIFVGSLTAWTVLGYFVCEINGYVLSKKLQPYYKSRNDMDRDMQARNFNATGETEATKGELLFDYIFWPRTLYYAKRGQKQIIEEFEKEMTVTMTDFKEDELDDC